MKPNRRNPLLRALELCSLAVIFNHSVHAASGTWNTNASGNWSTAGSWLNSIVANDASSTANFVFNITGNRTVTLDSNRTINKLVFTDATTASHDWTLARSGTNVLTLGGTTPTIDVTNRTTTISAVLAGGSQITKAGVGTLIVSGANTFSAGLLHNNGILQINNNTGAGTGNITLGAGTSGNGPRLQINGGVTIANAVSIPTTAGATGMGVFQQTGTGQGRVNGAISIAGSPVAGGHFVGGTAAGNELVMGGPITTTVSGLSQRDGRVIYAGGGSGGNWNSLTVTHTAIVGATNGIPTGVSVILGGSGNATFDLNGFDQALTNLTLGNVGNAFSGTINLGSKVLTLNGNLTSQSAGSQTVTHNINATAGSGTLAFGEVNRNIAVPNTLAAIDMAIHNATITGSGGFTKTGAGNLVLNNVTTTSPMTISGGSLTLGSNRANTLTPSTTSLAAGTTLVLDVGGDLISTGAITSAGTTLALAQFGGALLPGNYPLISYGGDSPGLSNFTADTTAMGHAVGTLEDLNGIISFNITGNDTVYWTGATSSDWATGTTGNWKLSSNDADADFITGDEVTFPDSPTSSSVSIATTVTASKVTFANNAGTDYTVSGAAGIAGNASLIKNGSGGLTLSTPNSYQGSTTLNGGTLMANFTAGTAIPSSGSISVAVGTTLTLAHNGGTFAMNHPAISGSGTLVIDSGLTTTGNRDFNNFSWDASGFSGTMRLAPTNGTMRIQVGNINRLGTGPLDIKNNGQFIFTSGNITVPNNISLTGIGYTETAGNLGALRASNPTTFTGTLSVVGSAKIGALGGTAAITNTISGGDLTFGGSGNQTSSETLSLTGDASGLTSITVNDGSAASGAANIVFNVGSGTTSGTIGSVPVTLKPDGFKSAVLRFDRSDGYTLGGAITSSATAVANEIRSFLDLDCSGTGFSDNGLTTSLGSAAPAAGGRVRIGITRPNTVATLSGTLTSETIAVSPGQNNSTLNIASGANILTNQLYIGDSSNNSGVVNQATESTVTVIGQVRVAHFATNSSTYNLNGGTLQLTGESPLASPSTAASGSAATYGDNNLNTLAANTIVGGGVYVGIDGRGTFNHNGGTLTTNWIVLDNRGASPAGVNMEDGFDSYNISGTSILNLRSTYGLIGRNDGSYNVNLGGGTIRVDNGGTGTGTGANIVVPIDAILTATPDTTTTLDTNAAINTGNAFSLLKNVTGTGTLSLTGGGTINFGTATTQSVSAALSSTGTSPNLTKLGAGATTITGSMSGFTGNVLVSEGTLNVPDSLDTAVTVSSGASLGGAITLPSLTLNGGRVLFNPSGPTPAITDLVLNGSNLLDVTSASGVGIFPAITYSNLSGGGTLAINNGSSYRLPPVVSDNSAGTISVEFFAGESLSWTGSVNSTWDLNSTSNWSDSLNPATFYFGDVVTFPTGPTATSIALAGQLAPASVLVTSDATTNYTLTSSTGNQLIGATGISKSGASTLTLVGPNLHSGTTSISGGILAIADPSSLGNDLPGNGLTLASGGALHYTGATSVNLGFNRSILADSDGGSIVHNNAANATISIPGALSGNGPLALESAAAGAGTFSLTGSNSAYGGDISVNASSTGLTALRIENSAAAPSSGSITLNYPAGGTSGNATLLVLPGGTTLPEGLTLNLTSALTSPQPPATVNFRSQISSSGVVNINGPVTLSGNSIVQTSPGAGSTLIFNGDISETTPGSFTESPLQANSNVLFLRGEGTNIVNGNILLPSAGSTVAVTDGATAVINSTENEFKSASPVHGTLRIGANDAIPTTARLVIGQSGNQACTLDLNGFDQTVTGLEWQAPTGNLLTKGISNTHPSNTSTFTLIQSSAPATSFNGTISGRTHFVKEGAQTTTLLAGASNFTGNVTVNNGTLVAGGIGANNGANGPLGAANVPGKTITVNTGAVLSFTSNNVFGNGNPNPDLPAITLDGGTLSSTRYNVIGNLALNGGTLTQSSTDGAGYLGYHFRGSITVGGTSPSSISTGNLQANHLATNTVFNVADASGSAAADLVVSAPLANLSADFSSTPGGLTKTGPGTMTLGGSNTYTGNTTVSEGTLELLDDAQLRFRIGATTGTNNQLNGAGSAVIAGDFAIDTTAADGLTSGTWLLEDVASLTGAYASTFRVVNTDGSPWTNVGDLWTKPGAGGSTWTFDEGTGTLTVALGGYESWSAQIPDAIERDRNDDPDGDGFTNGQEFLFGTSPIASDSKLMTTTTVGNDLLLEWLQRENGASYLLKESTTLTNGSWSTSAIIPVTGNQTGVPVDYDRYTATIPLGGGSKFFRIEGTED